MDSWRTGRHRPDRRASDAWTETSLWDRSSFFLPVAVAIVQVVGTSFAAHKQPAARSLDALGVLLLVAGPAALALRRRFPAPVLVFVFATTVAYHLLDFPRGPVFLALIVAFVGAILRGRRATALAVAAAGYVAFLWLGYLLGVKPAPTWGEALGLAAWMLFLVTFAEFTRSRKERALEARRVQRAEAQRKESEERLRVAQELHDVLGHNLSLISVQAGVALHLMDEKPEQARSALAAVKDASNQALGELRSVLDILRGSDESAPRSPALGLTDLDSCSRGAGMLGWRCASACEERLGP